MRHRLLALGAVALMVLCTPVLVAGQAPSGTATFDPTTTTTEEAITAAAERGRAATAAAANWTPPRTAWGDPDLQGFWFKATYTPLERPAALGDKAFYTEEEAIAAFRYAVESDAGVDPGSVHYEWSEFGMDAWQSPIRPSLRTSLIVDPPDGRIPPLTPEAEKRPRPSRSQGETGVRTMGNVHARCILGVGGPPLTEGGSPGSDSAAQAASVSAEFQILQTPGYVVLVMQSNNDVRIIPLDGRPHPPDTVRSWLGDPRGRWEGETLVVDSTNFLDRTPAANFQGATEALHLVERFTRVGPDTVRYEYTVDDPMTWTRAWTAETLLPRVEPPIYEWACHEQNYGLINVVTGAQTQEGLRQPLTPGSSSASGR